MTYRPHPSKALNEAFSRKPYQGTQPSVATFLFVGLDANYAEAVEQSPIFPALMEYHSDGVSFWKKYGVHHPFLLPGYTGDGRFYHQSFAKLGFRPEHASLVSFVELLHVATVGRNRLTASDLDPRHLSFVSSAIFDGNARHVFVPAAVERLMRETKAFGWLRNKAARSTTGLGVLFQHGDKTVYSHLHFSVYGKSQARKKLEAAAIRALLPS